MFKNYIKIAIRNLLRNKSITAIKLIGLIAALTGVILIVAYVRFELSFDRFNTKASRIYRIELQNTQIGQKTIFTPVGTGSVLEQEFPEVINHVILSEYKTNVQVGDHVFNEKILSAGKSFFNIFTLPLIKGNPETAISKPYTAVISQKAALQLFGNENPISKSIIIASDTKHPYLITGVMKNIPENSHFQGDIVRSIVQDSWTAAKLSGKGGYTSMPQYILLAQHANAALLENHLGSILKKYNFPPAQKLFLVPLTKIHLYSHLSYELEKNGDIEYVYIFSIIALLILIIACVNFINLTTGSHLKRTKEVGIRKVLGASKQQLRIQFLSEGFILFSVAILVSIVFAGQIAPWFGSVMGISINAHAVINGTTIGWAVILSIVTVLFAGFYPAVFLSRLSPSLVLRGSSPTGRSRIEIRKLLVLTQFVISIALIIATAFIYDQLNYIHTKNFGFNDKQVLFLPRNDYGQNFQSFKNELRRNSGIADLSLSSWNPGNGYGAYFWWNDKADSSLIYNFASLSIDFDFLKTLQIPLVAGRGFSDKYGADMVNIDSLARHASQAQSQEIYSRQSILLNEAAVRILGLTHPVSKRLKYSSLQGTVIGVVKNFNGLSLYKKVGPIVFTGSESKNYGWLFIRIHSTYMTNTISYINKVWKKYYPDKVFDYSFLDQYIQSQYKTTTRLGYLCLAFTLLAFLISCLGLFGLALFDTERRTKEIAIRKVFGASIKNILQMLNKNYVALVLIANIVAWPIAWVLVREWLNNFAYKIDVSFIPFLLACGVSLLLTMLTVSIQAWRAARTNPIDNLRSE